MPLPKNRANMWADNSPGLVQPRIAVCMAVWNGMQWLPEQLDSILSQTGVSVRVFVSVDCSSDGSEQWLNQRALTESRLVLLPHGVVFGGAAANFFRLLKTVDFADFDYVSLADQDDLWHPCKLQRACEQLQLSGAEAYSSNVWAFWPDGRKIRIEKSQPQRQWDFLFEAAGPGCTYVLEKNLALSLQDFLNVRADAMRGVELHDWFIYAYARSHGWGWLIDAQPNMDYRQHDTNQVGVNQGWIALRGRAAKVMNGWAFSQARLIARLSGLEAHAFVQSWIGNSPTGLLRLALQASQCRRRRRDQLFFALSCVLLAIKNGAQASKSRAL